MLELGRYFGVRRMATDPDGVKMGTTTIDAAVFGLLHEPVNISRHFVSDSVSSFTAANAGVSTEQTYE
jgi:hypothetical protein